MSTLLALGLSYKTAPLAVRETLAFDAPTAARCAQAVVSSRVASSLAIVSTCNRTEFYCEDLSARFEDFWDCLRQQKALPPSSAIQSCAYQYQGRSAVEHLLRVTTGLDSLVLGETQILGQMKSAYDGARQAGTLGKGLSRLFQFAFGVAKKIRTQTAIGASPLSIAYMASKLVKPIFSQVSGLTVLFIGSGEMIPLAARHFRSMGIAKTVFANRTQAKSRCLAQQFQGEMWPLNSLGERLHEADVVVTATASPLPLLGKGMVERALKARKQRSLLLIDLAVPRDIESEVGQLGNVYLYTVDDLQEIALDNRQARASAALLAESMICQESGRFMAWLKAQEAVGTIQAFRHRCKRIREDSLGEALAQLSAGKSPEVVVQRLAYLLTNRLMHQPTLALRQAVVEEDI